MSLDVTVPLIIKTCDCGTVYAVPNWVPFFKIECPLCAKLQRLTIEKERDGYYEKTLYLKRVIAGLRGARRRPK